MFDGYSVIGHSCTAFTPRLLRCAARAVTSAKRDGFGAAPTGSLRPANVPTWSWYTTILSSDGVAQLVSVQVNRNGFSTIEL